MERITPEQTNERVAKLAHLLRLMLESRGGQAELEKIFGSVVGDGALVTSVDETSADMPSVVLDGTGDQNVYVIMVAAS